MSQSKIKVITLFTGIGAQEAALKRLNIPFEVVGISEIDKYAIQSYNAINGPTFNYGDITKIPLLDYADLWTYSFPCFTADSLVLTEHNGYKQIVDIQIGESVLTHDGNFKTVENVINNGIKPTVKIYGMGFDEIHTTENHKFYVREKARVWNNLRRSYDRVFSNPIWKQAMDLTRNDYLGFPVNKKSIIPEWNGITFVWSDGRSDRHKNEISKHLENDNFWWLIGRYVADGYIRTNGGIILSCGKKKLTEFKAVADKLGINYSLSEDETVYRFHYSLKELELFVKPFGKYAFGKKIPSFVMNLPVKQLKAFLDGYMAGDGCFTNKKFKATSVSRELIYGLAQCVGKVYKRPFSIYKTKRAKTTVIEGRVVNQRDTYELTFTKENHIQDKAFYENGYIWYPFNKIEKAENEVVYDLTVSDNHSFVVNNAIVHNCQDLSVAGKQAGINEGTRSGLLLHVERLLEIAVLIGNQPKYLLLENVKALVSKKFKPDFDRWLQKLESLGYNNYWQVLNAKDYGVPQNRERVFVVSIRKDVDTKGYKFPEKIPLTRKLKDVLEPVVDEKYYLSQDKVDKLVMNMDKEVSNTIRCGGGGSLDGKHTWDMVPQPVNTDSDNCARTICSNYYKQTPDNVVGVGYGCTGVIEPLACASRGRNPENPSDRTAGAPTEQRLEVNQTGCSNTLTTVEKDNYLLEPLALDEQNNYIRKDGCVGTLTTDGSSPKHNNRVIEPQVVQLGNIVNTSNWDNPQAGRVYSTDDISPTLNTMQGGQREPKILDDTYANRAIREYNEFSPTIRAEREGLKVAEMFNPYNNSKITDIAPTQTSQCDHITTSSSVLIKYNNYRIRKLTPLECWRLMDFTDDEFYCAQLSGVSNSQLYKQAGNSICVCVLQAIFKELLA